MAGSAVALALRVRWKTAFAGLKALVDAGLVERLGKTRGNRYRLRPIPTV